jgi:hypothetical protein
MAVWLWLLFTYKTSHFIIHGNLGVKSIITIIALKSVVHLYRTLLCTSQVKMHMGEIEETKSLNDLVTLILKLMLNILETSKFALQPDVL